MTYTKTFLRVYACDSQTSEVTCKSKAEIDSKVKDLKVQFIYLETNFEGKNIVNPLVSYLKDVLPVGLDMDYVEQVSISLE